MHGCQRRSAAWKAATIALLAFLPALAQVGCGPVNTQRRIAPPAATGGATVADLASQLALEIVDSSPTRASLRRGGDTIMLFAEPGGRVYVNGRPVDVPGAGLIESGRKSVHFTPALINAIAAALPDRPTHPKPGPLRVARRKKTIPPGPETPKLGRVVIDAGHGGNDVGTDAAVRLYGIRLYEKTVNLSVALAVAKLMRLRGAEVHMTRTSDTSVSLDARVDMANRLKPKLFVSIHANSMPRTSMRGFLILRPSVASADSLAAAATIERHLVRIGLGGEVRKDVRDLRVLRKTTCPAVLVEMSYLSNRYDAQMLANSHSRAKIAVAIADAITEYLKKRPTRRRR